MGQQDPGVADARGSRRLLTARSTSTPQRPDLALHPRAVVGADGVVVGERAAGGEQCVGRGPLGGQPLLDRQVVVPVGEHGDVQRGAGRRSRARRGS